MLYLVGTQVDRGEFNISIHTMCTFERHTSLKNFRHNLLLCTMAITNGSLIPIPIPIQTLIALNLHLLTDSKALDPSRIQSHSPLTICLIAVGGNRSAWRKPTLKRRSGTIPCIPVMNPHAYIAMIYWWNSSAHGRHWELSVLRKDTKWQ